MTIVSDSTQEMITEAYIPLELLEISTPTVKIFALDSCTIGLSNSPPEKWQKNCLSMEMRIKL